MKDFKINDFITLKLEDEKTYIYIKGERFRPCMRLILQIPKTDVSRYEAIDSIDEASEVFKTLFQNKIMEGDDPHDISAEEEFWGHCSNIQAWAENCYDTRLLHSNISIPLLKKLVKSGDPKAKKIYKDEILMRFSSGYLPVIATIINEGFLDLFNQEELELLREEIRVGLEKFEDDFHYYQNYGVLNDIGLALNETGFYDEAIEILHKSLELKPNYAIALNNLGISYYYREDYAKAKEYYELSHKADPKYDLPLSNLSEIYYIQGDYRRAIDLAIMALKLNQKSYEAFFFMGKALYKLGWYKQAIDNYELGYKLNPSDKEMYSTKDFELLTNLAKAYRKKGYPKKALDVCKKALRLNPSYNRALKLKKKLQEETERKRESIK